jgi:hypothetical protein
MKRNVIKVFWLYNEKNEKSGFFLQNEENLAKMFCEENNGFTYKLETLM